MIGELVELLRERASLLLLSRADMRWRIVVDESEIMVLAEHRHQVTGTCYAKVAHATIIDHQLRDFPMAMLAQDMIDQLRRQLIAQAAE